MADLQSVVWDETKRLRDAPFLVSHNLDTSSLAECDDPMLRDLLVPVRTLPREFCIVITVGGSVHVHRASREPEILSPNDAHFINRLKLSNRVLRP